VTAKGKNKRFDLAQPKKPSGDFMILESLEQEKNNSRIIHVIKPGDSKSLFKIGRGHEAELRVNDISVSRVHAKIKFEKDNGRFLLEDNTSKFGTLVLINERTPLLPSFNKAVQVGRTVVNFSVKQIIRRPNQVRPPIAEMPSLDAALQQ
jgi:pSer/pThr/pTyr-binding forkhead associated (FHA) protein